MKGYIITECINPYTYKVKSLKTGIISKLHVEDIKRDDSDPKWLDFEIQKINEAQEEVSPEMGDEEPGEDTIGPGEDTTGPGEEIKGSGEDTIEAGEEIIKLCGKIQEEESRPNKRNGNREMNPGRGEEEPRDEVSSGKGDNQQQKVRNKGIGPGKGEGNDETLGKESDGGRALRPRKALRVPKRYRES